MTTNLVLEKPSSYETVDYDGLWKKLIHELFEEFVLFFLPELHNQIDFAKKPDFLQQELYKKIMDKKKGMRVADQIVKVSAKNGEEKWILVHIEVQGSQESDFSKRMFKYYYRIFDRFDQDIVAIALLTDDNKAFHPDTFQQSFGGTSLTYTYNTYKFHDHNDEELMQSDNPFAIAVMAAKDANKAKKNTEKRYEFKKRLFKLVFKKYGYPSEEQQQIYIAALFYFIDYLLQIPEELSKKLRDEIIQTKEGKEMAYVDRDHLPQSWAELEKVFKEEGKKSVALELLKDGMAEELVAKYAKLPIDEVKKLVEEKD